MAIAAAEKGNGSNFAQARSSPTANRHSSFALGGGSARARMLATMQASLSRNEHAAAIFIVIKLDV